MTARSSRVPSHDLPPRLHEMPQRWDVARVKRVSRSITERASGQEFQVALEDIEPWTARLLRTENTYSGEGIAFREGDVLFSKLRPYLAKVHVAERSGQAVGDFIVLRTAPHAFDSRYLAYLLLTPSMIASINAGSYGARMPRTSWDDLGSHWVPLPPVEEQRRIAAFLDHETSRIDELIREQERLIGVLQEKRQATVFWSVKHGIAKPEVLKDGGVGWLGSVPAHWQVARLKWMAKLESGHTPSKSNEEFWIDCTIPWVSLNDSKQLATADYISDTAFKINEAGLKGSSARMLPPRAVVFTRDATVGLAAITTTATAVSQHLVAWICNESKLIPEFLLLVLYAMEGELERLTFGATIRTIGLPDVRRLTAAFPPVAEQRHIVDYAFTEKAELDEAIGAAGRLVTLLQERRSALISAAVTGQIDVRGWRPSDEVGAVA